jgi:mannose-6-phosphate isomerase-like protein (cupin superfamily)
MIQMPDRSASESSVPPIIRNLFGGLLRRQASPHDGAGHVALFRAYERAADSPLVDLIHFVVLPPGASIGHHRHRDDNEYYVITQGTGVMHLDGHRVQVARGDVVANRPFGEHGLVNDSQEDLHVIVFKTSPGVATVDM